MTQTHESLSGDHCLTGTVQGIKETNFGLTYSILWDGIIMQKLSVADSGTVEQVRDVKHSSLELVIRPFDH